MSSPNKLHWLRPYAWCVIPAYVIYAVIVVLERQPGATILAALREKWHVFALITAYLVVLAYVGHIRRKRKANAETSEK